MISVKEAVAAAAKAIVDTFGATSPRLEEVEFSDENNSWMITLSFLREVEADEVVTSPFESFNVGRHFRREYKSVRVDAASGEVKSIRIRELQGDGHAAN